MVKVENLLAVALLIITLGGMFAPPREATITHLDSAGSPISVLSIPLSQGASYQNMGGRSVVAAGSSAVAAAPAVNRLRSSTRHGSGGRPYGVGPAPSTRVSTPRPITAAPAPTGALETCMRQRLVAVGLAARWRNPPLCVGPSRRGYYVLDCVNRCPPGQRLVRDSRDRTGHDLLGTLE